MVGTTHKGVLARDAAGIDDGEPTAGGPRRGVYTRLKRGADALAGLLLATTGGRRRRIGALLRAGRRTLVGPPQSLTTSTGNRIPRGLVHGGLVCEALHLEADAEELAREYAAKAGPRADLALGLQYLWARLVVGRSPRRPAGSSIRLFGLVINNARTEEMHRSLWHMLQTRLPGAGPGAMITFVNAHNLNIAHEREDYRRILADADLILPDGIGVKLAARWAGQPLRHDLNGTDLFPDLMELCTREEWKVFFLGAEQEVLDRAVANTRERFPDVQVAGSHHGYFGPDGEADLAAAINAAGADIVVIGMGTPRQELVAARLRPLLRVRGLFCMGGILDFVGGKNARAPQWMRRGGLEWCYRLWLEPGRMWRRYVLGNPLFLWRATRYCRMEARRRRGERSAEGK